MLTTFKEEKQIEVREHADVIVVGGGPSGVAASIAAARHGAKVLLIEKSIILGGLATAGHVIFYEPLCDGNGRQVCRGLVEEFLYKSIEYSYNSLPSIWERGSSRAKDPETHRDPDYHVFEKIKEEKKKRYQTVFNYPAFVLALEETALQENVNILYDTLFCSTIVENQRCTGVIVENISGRYAISCDVLIDASGSSIAFNSAGVNCRTGENKFTVEFLDTELKLMEEALKNKQIRKAINWRMIGFLPSAKGGKPEVYRGDTIEGVNNYILKSHATALDFLKENQRADYAMLSMPTMPQFRFIRQIEGRKTMQAGDVFKYMDDSVGCVSDWRKSGPIFEVPYSCLLSPEFSNMAAVGRNISSDNDMWDLMRCYPGAVTTGQAAGTAAAIAVQNKVDLDKVDIALLQKVLTDDGVIIHQDSI